MNHVKEMREYASTLDQAAPEGVDLKVGDIVVWENDFGVRWKSMVIGFSFDNSLAEYGNCVHFSTHGYWMPHKPEDVVEVVGHLNKEGQVEYFAQKENRASGVNSLGAFIREYSLIPRTVHELAKEIEEKGFCLIPAEESSSNKAVTFYDHFQGVNKEKAAQYGC